MHKMTSKIPAADIGIYAFTDACAKDNIHIFYILITHTPQKIVPLLYEDYHSWHKDIIGYFYWGEITYMKN